MHELSIPADLVARVTERAGRPHPFDVIDPAKTAFVVVDMQNYFMKPGFQGEVPKARAIVPAVNRLAAAVRELGGHVVWVKNATNDTRESWSVFHDWLHTPERRDRRYATMDLAHEGHALWGELGFGHELGELLDAPWPKPDPGALQVDVIEWVVQVNGKLRGSIRIPAGADRPAIESAVLEDSTIQRHLTGPIKKLVIVPGKLVNVVL